MNTTPVGQLLVDGSVSCVWDAVRCALGSWAGFLTGLAVVVHLVLWPVRRFTRNRLDQAGEKERRLKPLVAELRNRFHEDPQAYQQALIHLYEEQRYNPFAYAIGCLPVLTEIPLWVGLGLYFSKLKDAVDQVLWPGVFGPVAKPDLVWPFPWLNGWPTAFKIPGIGTVEGFNLLPVLVLAVFLGRLWLDGRGDAKAGPLPSDLSVPPRATEVPVTNPAPVKTKKKGWGRLIFGLVFLALVYNAPSGLTFFMLVSALVGLAVESWTGYGRIINQKRGVSA